MKELIIKIVIGVVIYLVVFNIVSYLMLASKRFFLKKCTLERIVDGDTIEVNIKGKLRKVRLIGIDTPESVNPDTSKNTPQGVLATIFLKRILDEGSVLYLQRIRKNKDIYKRLLRYVWIEKPKSTARKKQVITKMLNCILVKEKIAYPIEYDNGSYLHIFNAAFNER